MKNLELLYQSSFSQPPVTLVKSEKRVYPDRESISILIGGSAGAGIKTLENLLSDAFKQAGYFVFSTKEYMSRVRGGSNTTLLRISNIPEKAPCWHVDIFVALDENSINHVKERLTEKTVIIADNSMTDTQRFITKIPMINVAKNLGNVRYANSYVAGLLFGILGLNQEKELIQTLQKFFEKTALEKNTAAIQEGLKHSYNLQNSILLKLPKPNIDLTKTMHLLDGSTASGFGFLAGGCNMISSYPMSPSTGVLNFMASMSEHLTVMVEQSEDEIAALNMVLGGWFGGARAMTSTSGGGFSLMSEAISLSGMSETPAVIYLAQRPGPATGLPTRTEQGDLNLAIHSGHGDFGRVVLAPGDLQECIDFGYLSFELADRFQVPVIYLSDQYLVDSIGMIETVDFSDYEQRRYIEPTHSNYNRYSLTDTGISPRGIPNVGEGIIIATSDEHDVRGQITESHQVREQMVSKRQKKIEQLISYSFPPQISSDGSIAVIGWGSTKGIIEEALKNLNDSRLFQVHFAWVHPLNPKHLDSLKQTKHNIIVENNVTGTFADILKHHDVPISSRILQANGFPFFVDQLTEKLAKSIKELL